MLEPQYIFLSLWWIWSCKELHTFCLDSNQCQMYNHISIGLYTKNLLLLASNLSQLQWIKQKLAKTFEMKDLGKILLCLWFEFTRHRNSGSLSMNQFLYIDYTQSRFNMSHYKGAATNKDESRYFHKTYLVKKLTPLVKRKISFSRSVAQKF